MKSIINDVYISLCKFVFFMKGLKKTDYVLLFYNLYIRRQPIYVMCKL